MANLQLPKCLQKYADKISDVSDKRAGGDGYGDQLEYPVSPMTLYRTAAESCFLANAVGPAVDALRRGCNALFGSGDAKGKTVFRLTGDFDKLIEFEEPRPADDKFACRVCGGTNLYPEYSGAGSFHAVDADGNNYVCHDKMRTPDQALAHKKKGW